jgi:hypothetical protein
VLEPVISSEAFRRNWARLIQKVYEVSPLVCPRCKKEIRVVAVIDNIRVIRRILEHLGLWLANRRPEPKAHSPPELRSLHEDSCYSQLPTLEEEDTSQLRLPTGIAEPLRPALSAFLLTYPSVLILMDRLTSPLHS